MGDWYYLHLDITGLVILGDCHWFCTHGVWSDGAWISKWSNRWRFGHYWWQLIYVIHLKDWLIIPIAAVSMPAMHISSCLNGMAWFAQWAERETVGIILRSSVSSVAWNVNGWQAIFSKTENLPLPILTLIWVTIILSVFIQRSVMWRQ